MHQYSYLIDIYINNHRLQQQIEFNKVILRLAMTDSPQIIEKEVKQTISRLNGLFEHQQKVKQIITQLYIKSVKDKRVNTFKDEADLSSQQVSQIFSQHQLFQNQITQIFPTDKSITSQVKYIIQAAPYPPSFQSEIDQIQFYQKKIAAQSYLRWGYNYYIFNDQIRKRGGHFDVFESRYKKIAHAFITDVYLKIENFLQLSCLYEIKRSFQMKGVQVYSVLFNCRRYFSKEDIITFFKFIVLLFEDKCQSIQVSRSQVISFYETSRQIMMQKLQNSQKTSLNPQHIPIPRKGSSQMKVPQKVIDQHPEDLIIQIYIVKPRILQTKQQFSRLYGYCQEYHTCSSIKSFIFKTLRKSIKAMQRFYRQHFMMLPKMVELNDDLITKILINPQAAYLRVKLLKFSKKKEVNINILGDIINEINKYIKKRQQQDKQKIDVANDDI